jgi:MFS family permease
VVPGILERKKMTFRAKIALTAYGLSTLFLLYEMALQVSPSIMTRQLMASFGIGAGTLGVMASFYFYSYTLMQIPVGLLYDRFNARIVISLSVFFCCAGAFFFGLTTEVAYASLGRFLMGMGSAFAFVGVLVVAARWFPPYYFAFLVGVAQLLAALGALGGELPLATLVNAYGWREMIIAFAIFGALLALLCALFLRDRPSGKGEHPHHYHLNFWESLREVFHSKESWWIALYAFVGWGPITVFAALWGIPFLMVRYSISNTWAAFACAMIWIGLGCTSPFLGWLSDKLQRRCLLLRFCCIVGFISSLIVLYVPRLPFWLTFFFLFGIGIACSGQILSFALVKDNNRPSVTATAIGLNNMAVVAGGAFFQPFVGWLLQLGWNGKLEGGVPIYLVESYQKGFIVVPLCFFIGFIVSSFVIKETYCRPTYDTYSDQLF